MTRAIKLTLKIHTYILAGLCDIHLSCRMTLFVLAAGLVGYTMRDIRYKWFTGPTSVGISKEVELPQFRVLGHRQRATVINLTTGNQYHLKSFLLIPIIFILFLCVTRFVFESAAECSIYPQLALACDCSRLHHARYPL